MKKIIVILSILSGMLLMGSIIMLGSTYGWFSIVYTLPEGQVGVGELKYSSSGSLLENGSVIVPGENLVAEELSALNESSITSQLRIRITYTKITNNNGTISSENINFANQASDHISVSMNDDFVYQDGYFYLSGTAGILSTNSGAIALVSSIYYLGEYTGIDYANQSIEVSVVVEVKQADNVTWTELQGYDFSTGYPA